MPAALILEFEGVGNEQYEAVNSRLGIDMGSGRGDWPAGLLTHIAGPKPGGWVVLEVWDSQQSQERFMQDRLGRALQEGGIEAPPSRIQWLDPAVHHNLPG